MKTYTTPGFPDENGDGCPDDLMPNPLFVKGVTEPCIAIESTPSLPDELAHTGVFDIAAPALGALVLLYAGLALLRGRRA